MLTLKELRDMGLEKGRLGNAIRRARTEKNISQERLAEMLDITPTHLKHLESEHRRPSVEVLFRLAEILRFSIDDLIFEEREKTKEYRKAEMLLSECDRKELLIAADVIKALIAHREEEDADLQNSI